MALKKPSDFFGNNKKTPLDEVKESYESARPEKIEQVSEAFDAFKSNLNHLQSLSDFTSTFDSFKNNLEKVESVSSEVSGIKEEIKSLIKKEDLDSAMMAQLLFVEESISKIESKVSSVNGKTVDKIREDFVNLSNSVESFLDVDVPKYKKLISESEVRFDDRLDVFKEQVEENLDSIKEDVSKEVTTALETVESVNENTINIVKAEFKETARDFNKNVNELVEKELPKYKKLFAETEVRTEEKVNEVIDTYRQNIEDLNAKVKLFTETEIPKYSNLLVETKLKSEQEVKELEEEVLSKVNALSEKIQFISEGIPEKTSEKIQELKDVTDQYKEEIDSIAKKYQSLYKDFKKREVSENEKLESYSNKIEKYNKRFSFLEETVQEDLRDIQEVLIQSNETYHASLKTEVGKFRNKISEQMEGLQMDLVVNEKHIKKQNENIETVKEEIQEVLKRLQLDTLEEKNKELVEKITYLEETISEINEKKLLTEDNPTLPGDPSTNNSSDPLTPLNQKFATLDDLQNHYRLFINRIQQQIATIGGGGIEDAPNDGQTYSRKNRTWVVGGGGSGGIAGVGIQSGSVRVGTGFTDINFTGAGITVVGSGTTVTVDIPSSTITRQTETSSGVTTDFTITGGYTVGLIDVYLNGVKQRSGVDFTASDGSTVTMTPFISDGDVVEFQKYDKLNIAGITSVVNATNAYNIVGGVSFATSAGIATALNSDSSVNTSGIITASGGFVGNVTGTSTGLSGTPDITIQNLTGVAATFTGIVTYEDVTNIDSVGIVTARSGLRVVGGGLTVTGVSTFFDEVSFQGGLVEKFQTGTTLAADNTLALSDGNVIRRTSNESGNQTVNFTGVHSTLSNGDLVSFTVIITPNGSGAINVVQIDGQAITIKWSGGSAPSAGSSGKDVYTFSVFKTGTGVSDYEVYGAATNYA